MNVRCEDLGIECGFSSQISRSFFSASKRPISPNIAITLPMTSEGGEMPAPAENTEEIPEVPSSMEVVQEEVPAQTPPENGDANLQGEIPESTPQEQKEETTPEGEDIVENSVVPELEENQEEIAQDNAAPEQIEAVGDAAAIPTETVEEGVVSEEPKEIQEDLKKESVESPQVEGTQEAPVEAGDEVKEQGEAPTVDVKDETKEEVQEQGEEAPNFRAEEEVKEGTETAKEEEKEEAKDEVNEEEKEESKEEVKEEVKEENVKEEVKEEVEEENVKEEAKDEVNEEEKEEVKEEGKEEVKEEVKEPETEESTENVNEDMKEPPVNEDTSEDVKEDIPQTNEEVKDETTEEIKEVVNDKTQEPEKEPQPEPLNDVQESRQTTIPEETPKEVTDQPHEEVTPSNLDQPQKRRDSDASSKHKQNSASETIPPIEIDEEGLPTYEEDGNIECEEEPDSQRQPESPIDSARTQARWTYVRQIMESLEGKKREEAKRWDADWEEIVMASKQRATKAYLKYVRKNAYDLLDNNDLIGILKDKIFSRRRDPTQMSYEALERANKRLEEEIAELDAGIERLQRDLGDLSPRSGM